MKNILLLSLRNSDFTEMFRAAKTLEETGEYHTHIISFTSSKLDEENQEKRCKECNIDFIKPAYFTILQKFNQLFGNRNPNKNTLPPPNIRPQPKKSILNITLFLLIFPISKLYRLIVWLSHKPPLCFISGFIPVQKCIHFTTGIFHNLIYCVKRFTKAHILSLSNQTFYKIILKEKNIDLIILAEDIVGPYLPNLIRAGHKRNIPTLILPYTICNAIEAAEALKDMPEYHCSSRVHYLFAKIFPAWAYHYKEVDLLRMPINYLTFHVLFRMNPPNPWMMNSGYADAIAIESKKMKDYYLKEGFKEETLHVTGAMYDDTLAHQIKHKAALRQAFFARHDREDKPMILFGAPPDQLTDSNRLDVCEFKEYNEALHFIAKELAKYKEDYHIVIRPHPNFTQLETIFEQYDLTFTLEDTATLIPLSDLYIACASATIRWAIAAGVPALNYDLFGYNYDDYKSANGVLYLLKKEEFRDTLARILTDKDYYVALQQTQRKESTYWGNLDGQSTKRITQLCEQLMSQKKLKRKPNSVTLDIYGLKTSTR